MPDDNEFLPDEYNSDDEVEKVVETDIVGGGNLAPEVLKMLQQMAPAAPIEKTEDEPDEIKVCIPPAVS